MGLHRNEIIEGYELACLKTLAELESTFLFLSTLSLCCSVSYFPFPPFFRDHALMLMHDHKQPYQQLGSEHILAVPVVETALAVMLTCEEGFCVDDVQCVTGFLLSFFWCVGMKANFPILCT